MIRFASAEEWVRIQFAATPLASLLRERDEGSDVVARVSADVGASVETLVSNEGFAFPQEVPVVPATNEG